MITNGQLRKYRKLVDTWGRLLEPAATNILDQLDFLLRENEELKKQAAEIATYGFPPISMYRKLERVADAAEVGLTISCDGKTRPCGVCDLRESLQALRGSK